MNLKIFVFILFFILACKPSKNSSNTTTTEPTLSEENNSEVWTRQDYRPTKDIQLPNSYETYILNVQNFQNNIDKGKVFLPLDDGLQLFEVEQSNTISEEMRNKFPNINSYKGIGLSNKLCQCAIDKKDSFYSITVFCNDKTIYVKDLFKNGIYFMYNKKDVPNGVGTVNE